METTLPERVGFLQVVPAADLFALLLVAILLGQSFVSEAGVQVELPVSRYQLTRASDASVITLTEGKDPVLWLDRERMSEEELIEALNAIRERSAGVPSVYLRSDKAVAAGEERRVAELALAAGFRVYLLGQPKEGP
ncbi:ExbD/TolR family protein [Haloferula sp. A504]|uniref:ExbD/TolR family protein n=1 Tax=Haloferula sp. A504 TaxID=3373601 RepID=UPI0031C8C988|nr:biopolymer transporter ExbD [Verrucomicrobiaceae bacterium E54]